MAEVAGISDSSVQRIRRDHGLKPHRVLTRALRWVELSTTCGSNVNGQIAWFSPIWITAKER